MAEKKYYPSPTQKFANIRRFKTIITENLLMKTENLLSVLSKNSEKNNYFF